MALTILNNIPSLAGDYMISLNTNTANPGSGIDVTAVVDQIISSEPGSRASLAAATGALKHATSCPEQYQFQSKYSSG